MKFKVEVYDREWEKGGATKIDSFYLINVVFCDIINESSGRIKCAESRVLKAGEKLDRHHTYFRFAFEDGSDEYHSYGRTRVALCE